MTVQPRVRRAVSVLFLMSVGLCVLVTARQEAIGGFQGEAAETFLSSAEVTDIRPVGEGITRPDVVRLELGGVTHRAVFKTIDHWDPGFTTMRDGRVVMNFRDTFRSEIAAYVVDQVIGLGLVPATVERSIGRRTGSLQWWVEGVSERERVERGLTPPDAEAWVEVHLKRRLFDQLIDNTDRNGSNLLVTADFQLRLIDHSRSFTHDEDLQAPDLLTRFSRSLLDGLEKLEFDDLKARLGRRRHLTDRQIRALLARRDAILELVRRRVAEFGEDAVLYR